MSRTDVRRLLSALLVIAIAGGVAAQTAIGVSVNANLGFGDVVVSAAGGSVTVSPQGVRSTNGGVWLGNGALATPAELTVVGEPAMTYSISLPDSVTLTHGGDALLLDNFTTDPSGTGQLDATGTQQLSIGATLHLNPDQPPGAYAGSLTVTVSYN